MNSKKFFTTLEQHQRHKALYNLKWGFPHKKSAIEPENLQRWIQTNGPYMYHGTTKEAAQKIADEGLYPHDELPNQDDHDWNIECNECGHKQPHDINPSGDMGNCEACNKPFSSWDSVTPSQGHSQYEGYFRTRPGHVYLGTQPYVHSSGYIKGGLLGIDLRKLDPDKFNADEDHFVEGSHTFSPNHPVINKLYESGEGPPHPSLWGDDPDSSETLGDWADNANLGNELGETQYSLEKGSMAYNGHIPPEAIHVSGTGPRGFTYNWLPQDWSETAPKTAKGEPETDELHVGLDVPQYTGKAIYRWARDQDWPEGTELEQPSEYHCTLLYSKSGSHWRYNPWWVEKIDQGKAHVSGFDSFGPNDEGQYAYVLKLDSPEIQEVGQKMTDKGGQMGLDITFPEYKPHITIGYGPSKVTGIEAPGMEIDLGPSSISDPRISALDQPFQPDPAAQALDHLSLASVAHNLHYRFEKGLLPDPASTVDFANRLLKMIGYPPDDMTTQAAIQAWQQMYPQDRLLPIAPEPRQIEGHIDNDYDNLWHTSGKFFSLPEYRPDWPPPGGTHACPTCGLGVISHGMYGWSDASKPAPANMSWNCPNCNTDFDPVVTRPMPHSSYVEPQVLWIPAEEEEDPEWKKKNVQPSLSTDWEAFSEDEKHHNDVSFSNDTKNLA